MDTSKQDLIIQMLMKGDLQYLRVVPVSELNKPGTLGVTPLFFACWNLSVEAVAALLYAGADPDVLCLKRRSAMDAVDWGVKIDHDASMGIIPDPRAEKIRVLLKSWSQRMAA
jgi:hypothetical protein